MKRLAGLIVMFVSGAAFAQDSGEPPPEPIYVEDGTTFEQDEGGGELDGELAYPEDDGSEPYDTYDDLPAEEEPETLEAPPPEAQANVSVETFERELAPHGQWVQTSTYGRVWRPNPVVVGVDFRPYATGGRWVYARHGWTWHSDFSWGWAPFHYGRWYADTSFGWVWVPDTTWGPAWVDWRYGAGYVGWAPLGPRGWRASADWCFVPQYRMRSHRVHRHFVHSRHVYAHTRPVHRQVGWGHRRWNAGPSAVVIRSHRNHGRPGYGRPGYRQHQRPGVQQHQRPGYRQHQGRGYQQPRHQQPRHQRPGYQQHRQAPQRRPVMIPPAGGGHRQQRAPRSTYNHQRPGSGYQQQRPAYQQQRQRPSYQQQRPSVQRHQRSAPSYQQRSAPRGRPTMIPASSGHRQPSYNRGGGRGGGDRGGYHRGGGQRGGGGGHRGGRGR